MGLGDLDAVFVFGGEDNRFIGAPRQLPFDRAEVGFDGVGCALADGAFDDLAADAERVGLIENDRLHFGGVFVRADDAQNHSRPVLLHLDRGRVDIERSGGEQQPLGVAEDFARRGIEVRFEEHHAIVATRRLARFADEEPQNVRAVVELHRPRAVADRFDGHLGEAVSELIDDDLDDGRSGGRGEFGLDRHIDERHTFEEFGGAGRGDRADAVGDLGPSVPRWDRAANDFVHTEQREADRGGRDIDDGVDRADFVKVNLLGSRAMHGRFGFGHGGEDAKCEIALVIGQHFRAVDDLLDISQVAVSVLFRVFDAEMLRAEAASQNFFHVERDTGQLERVDSRFDRGEIDARIDECRHGHVAADSRSTVQIRNSHEVILWSKSVGGGLVW